MDVCKPNYNSIECTIQTLKGEVYKAIDTGSNFCTAEKKKVRKDQIAWTLE